MIVRLSHALAKRIGQENLPFHPSHPNPLADWSGRLFTADRVHYLIITNTALLYSAVIHAKGIINQNILLIRLRSAIREVMDDDAFGSLYAGHVAPEMGRVVFAKSLNRSVTGSVNDFVFLAKHHLTGGDVSPYDVSVFLNDTPMSYLNYKTPRDALVDFARQISAL